MLDIAARSTTAGELSGDSLWQELRQGLSNQARVIHAIILRETRTRFGKQQLGFLWAFLEPVMFIGTFFAVFWIAERPLPLGMDIISFISTGLLPFLAFRNIAGKTLNATSGNQALLQYPRVKHMDLVLARFLLEFSTFATVFVVLLATSQLVHHELRPIDDVMLVVQGFVGAACLGFGFGAFMHGLAIFAPAIEKVQSTLMRPLLWVSGVFFTANGLGERARDILLWNPVMHAVEMIRSGFFPSYDSQFVNPSYLFFWALILCAGGLHFQRFALLNEDS